MPEVYSPDAYLIAEAINGLADTVWWMSLWLALILFVKQMH